MAVLDVFLGIVPGAAARGHRDGDEQAGDDDAEQHGAERREARRLAGRAAARDQEDREVADDRRQHRQQRGHDHFADRGLGEHVDRAAVVRLLLAFHDARVLAELPAHLFDDRAGGTADRGHAHGGEQIGQQAAEQQTDHDVGVGQREVEFDVAEVRMGRRVLGEEQQVLVISREQHQRAEAGRTDGIALGDRLGGVADRIERVGELAHALGQAGHFGNAAGIVGDRAEGVERNHHAGERQHRGDRDRDAEQSGLPVGHQDAGDDHDGRSRGRLHRDGEALDHVGAVAGHRGRGDRLHRAEIGAGVVFGDPDNQPGHHQADDGADEQRRTGEGHARDRAEADQPVRDVPDGAEREHRRGDEALVERAHDRLALAEPHEERAGDRGDDADAADAERIDHHLEQHRRAGEEDRGQHHGGDDGHRIGLEQVGGHAGAVADIVAHVVGDGGRIARIVFRNAGFHLADQIAADVGAFGEDAAAETGEDRDQRRAEA